MNYVFLYCLICICQNIVCSSLVEEIKNIIISFISDQVKGVTYLSEQLSTSNYLTPQTFLLILLELKIYIVINALHAGYFFTLLLSSADFFKLQFFQNNSNQSNYLTSHTDETKSGSTTIISYDEASLKFKVCICGTG